MKNLTLSLFASLFFFGSLCAQIVNIPDANFKAALMSNLVINTNGDEEIQVAEAEAYDGVIEVSGLNIADLTGIEAFTAIDTLDCSYNQLTSLDVKSNPALVGLNCRTNQISELDVSLNPALAYLLCSRNQLAALDVSANPALVVLDCSANELTNLDVNSNPALVVLDCSANQLATLDVNSNPALEILVCSANELTNLDVNSNLVLRILYSNNNLLTSLDASSNPALVILYCYSNQLWNLNVQNGNNTNMSAINFKAYDNPELHCIQVDDAAWANTYWSNVHPAATFSTDCPEGPIVVIPDANFKAALLNNPAINTNSDSEIQVSEAEAYDGLIDASGLDITDLNGIKAFTGIDTLDCSLNQLSALNVSGNEVLKALLCSGNQIVRLDLTENTTLTTLSCSDNQLAELNIQNGNNTNISFFEALNNPGLACIQVDDPAWATTYWSNFVDSTTIFSADCGYSPIVHIPDANFKAALVNNPAINTNDDDEIQLTEAQAYDGEINVAFQDIAGLIGIEAFTAITALDCSDNQITSLDVSANTALIDLNCSGNLIAHLNISMIPVLEVLNCRANSLESLNVSGNPALARLIVTYNNLDTLDISANPALEYFEGRNNSLDALDVSANLALQYLECSNNELTSLDISVNLAMESLYCSNNQFTSLDVSDNPALKVLNCSNNHLTELNINSNLALINLYCSSNQITSLNVNGNLALEYLYCSRNQLMGLDLSANPNLVRLYCADNQLANLDVRNGANIYLSKFDARNNPNLTCIQVDDAEWFVSQWSGYADPTATFSTDCTNSIDRAGESFLSVYPNPTFGGLTLSFGVTYSNVRVTVNDAMGQELFRKVFASADQLVLDIKGPSGLFFVRVWASEGEMVTFKVMKL